MLLPTPISSRCHLILSKVFIAAEYYLPLYFQSVKEASPLRSGVLLVPLIVATAGTGVLNGLFIHRTGQYRPPMWIGTILMTLGNGLYIMLNPDTSIGAIIAFEIIEGIGSGLLFEPPLLAIQQGVSQDDVGTATSTQSFVRSMALSFGVIVGGIVFQQSMDLRQSVLRDAGLAESVLEQLGKECWSKRDGRSDPSGSARTCREGSLFLEHQEHVHHVHGFQFPGHGCERFRPDA